MKRERLFARQIPKRSTGISDADIARIHVVPELVGEVIDCLESDDDLDVVFGLFFAECLRKRAEFVAAAGTSLSIIADLIRKALDHSSPQVRWAAVSAFLIFRESYEDYAEVMKRFLGSPECQIRRIALGAAPTFFSVEDLNLLLPFQNDPEFGETDGMGGPLRYDLRDLALEVAELVTGRQFSAGDCFERRDGRQISWRSWSKFSQWLEGGKVRRFFGF